MFPINETVLGAEGAYRREQLLASLPARRERAQRRALAARVASRVAARRSVVVPRQGMPTAAPQGRVAAPAQGTPGACAA